MDEHSRAALAAMRAPGASPGRRAGLSKAHGSLSVLVSSVRPTPRLEPGERFEAGRLDCGQDLVSYVVAV